MYLLHHNQPYIVNFHRHNQVRPAYLIHLLKNGYACVQNLSPPVDLFIIFMGKVVVNAVLFELVIPTMIHLVHAPSIGYSFLLIAFSLKFVVDYRKLKFILCANLSLGCFTMRYRVDFDGRFFENQADWEQQERRLDY